ncbi:MAG: ribonuclease III [Spirochaetia bacterium]|nr:ribonuclease III [Spirochaetia bacterium]
MSLFRKKRPSIDAGVAAFLKRLSVKPGNAELFEEALTHRSFLNESGGAERDNQRLEYLGDSVLGLVVNDYLYSAFPHSAEGELARMKSAVVSEAALADIARVIELGDVIRMGRGADVGGGRTRPSILADAFEALIGAIYLDSGLEGARKFLLRLFPERISRVHDSERGGMDSKSTLQEWIQKQTHVTPYYEIVSESGPDHKKEFSVKVIVNGEEIGRGSGTSRKRAEQAAAEAALDRLKGGRTRRRPARRQSPPRKRGRA